MAERRLGRPPLPEGVRLGEKRNYAFRLTDAELDALCREAIAAGLSLSVLVRDIVRRHVRLSVAKPS